MKLLVLLIALLSSQVAASDFPGQFSGEVAIEYRYFSKEGDYGNNDKHHSSVLFKPEYSRAWDNDRNVISIVPFARIDQIDNSRSHFDIREFSFVSSWSHLELRFGISKVFWGVTESRHLVDIINQTDFIESPDSEQKLGQPMINPILVTAIGNFEYYVLPFFRERTFPSADGRYRGPVLVDTDSAEYTSDDKNRHIDYALRWSANWQDMEWAISWFKGTDRDPYFRFESAKNMLIPVYGQTRQLGLEMQYIYRDWLFKTEFLRKHPHFNARYSAATTGFEYTLTNVKNGMDIGLLYEWLYNSRENASTSVNYDASFYGLRLAVNDEVSTQILTGAIYNNDTSDLDIFRIEASRRIGQSLKLGLEVNVIGKPHAKSALKQLRSDDYIQMTLRGYY